MVIPNITNPLKKRAAGFGGPCGLSQGRKRPREGSSGVLSGVMGMETTSPILCKQKASPSGLAERARLSLAARLGRLRTANSYQEAVIRSQASGVRRQEASFRPDS